MTGDVKIDPNGNTMTGLRLKDSAGFFFVAPAVLPPGGAFVTNSPAGKFWARSTRPVTW
jgi:hypothetical protein